MASPIAPAGRRGRLVVVRVSTGKGVVSPSTGTALAVRSATEADECVTGEPGLSSALFIVTIEL